jgi:hypothetical protein
MIDRENLTYINNILSLHNENVNLDVVYNILTAIKENNNVDFFNIMLNYFRTIAELKENLIPLLYTIKDQDELSFYSNILKITNRKLDTNYLKNVLLAIKHNPSFKDNILDSFGTNQLKSKTALLDAVDRLDILDANSNVVIWGCWYGSILIPSLAKKVNKVTGIDLDEQTIKLAKNKFFQNYDNVELISDDIFNTYRNIYLDTNLIINTSCEHMKPMKEWSWFDSGAMEKDSIKIKWKTPKISNNCWFAFQSNNMYGINGHINCVDTIEEFQNQLPVRAEVHYQKEIKDERGTRFLLVGKLNTL